MDWGKPESFAQSMKQNLKLNLKALENQDGYANDDFPNVYANEAKFNKPTVKDND